MMKTVIKNIVCCLLFVSMIVGSLVIGSSLVEPKGNSKEDGMKDYSAVGIVSEPKDTIDAVFVGDSESYRAIMPLKIWKDHGITGYVCSTPSQRLYYSLELLEKALSNQKPKYVFIETNSFFREFTVSDVIVNKAERLVPFFRYHTRVKYLRFSHFKFGNLFSSTNYSYTVDDKGYRLSVKVKPGKTKGYMSYTNEIQLVPEKNANYIKRIKDFCESRGAKLVFLSIPSTQNYNYKKHNGIAKLSKELGVEYIDMNLLKKEIPIDWKTDTYDKGDHMNYFGALKTTAYLGNYLASSGEFSDKRGDTNYKGWFDSAEKFNLELSEALKKNEKRSKKNKKGKKEKAESTTSAPSTSETPSTKAPASKK